MKKEKLDLILESHKSWLIGNGGERADLSSANLSNANLSNADLSSANLSNADLRWMIPQDVMGQTVMSVQVNTSRNNNQISYWKDLNIWTTGCFQGTLKELKYSVGITHKDNDKMRIKYYKVIEFILEMSEY